MIPQKGILKLPQRVHQFVIAAFHRVDNGDFDTFYIVTFEIVKGLQANAHASATVITC